MGIFDGAIQTKTRVPLDGDAFQPEMGSLVGSVFKEEAKVLGTRNELVTGDTTLNFLTNVMTRVNGNNVHTTSGTSNKTIIGIYTKVTQSVYIRQVMAVEMKLTVGATIKTTLGPVVASAATQSMETTPQRFNCDWGKADAFVVRFAAVGTDVAIKGINTQLIVFEARSAKIQTCAQGIVNKKVDFIANRVMTTALAIHRACSDIRGIHSDIRSLRAGIGTELSTPPSSMPGLQ